MGSSTEQRESILSILDGAYKGRVSNVRQSIEQAHEALSLARELKDLELVGKCLNHVSLFYMIVGENELSMKASHEAIDCFTELNDEMGIADARYSIGSVYYKSGNNYLALNNLVEALGIYRKFGAHGNQSRVYKTLGTIYEYFGDENNALTSYSRSVEAARLAGDLNMESNVYNPLSGIYLDQGKVEKAIDLIERSIAIKTQTGDIRGLAFAFYGRGKIHTHNRQFAEAEKDFREAERIHLEMGEKLGLSMNYYKLGKMYTAMGQLENALTVLQQGRAFCEEYSITQFKYKCDLQLYKVYKQLGNTEKALLHLEEYLATKGDVINIETIKMIENYEQISRQQLIENKELLQAKELVESQNEKLLKANAEMDQFVYRASHDLRAPVSSIMGLVNIGLQASDLEEAKQYLELIDQRVRTQDYFIRQIVDNAKNARLAIDWEDILIKGFIREALQPLLLIEGVEQIRIDVAADDELTVRSDASRLGSIFNNLVNNAILYRDREKEKPFIQIGCREFEDKWELTVKDNGQGILPERQDKIFDMFYRGNEQSTGSGLGLFIVKEMVKTLGGSIDFESEYGVGSEFRVVFPVGEIE